MKVLLDGQGSTRKRLGGPLASETSFTAGNWQRVGFNWDGANRRLYMDGALVAEDTQADLKSASGDLHIGAGRDLAQGTLWSGVIDDVLITNGVVTS